MRRGLPNIHHREQYEQEAGLLPDYRVMTKVVEAAT